MIRQLNDQTFISGHRDEVVISQHRHGEHPATIVLNPELWTEIKRYVSNLDKEEFSQ